MEQSFIIILVQELLLENTHFKFFTDLSSAE
jgi:hypothetical protein